MMAGSQKGDSAMQRRSFLGAAAAVAAAGSKPLRAATTYDVVVIGAGLSGLKAALDLQDLGFNVQVIEGRDRVGGRVFTLKDIPGHPEAGGNTFGGGYGRVLDMCDRFKLKLWDLLPRAMLNVTGLYLQGRHVALKDWPTSPLNILPEPFKSSPPFGLVEGLYAKTQPLKNPDDWYDPAFAKYDIPVHQFLKGQGFTDAQIDLFFNTNINYGTSAHEVSLLMMYFVEVWGRTMMAAEPTLKAVVGGNSLLPEAMAGAVKNGIHFNRTVVGVRADQSRAEVVCADGSVYGARQVICTLPMPAMRYVRFEPGLEDAHNAAVKTAPYFPMTQVHLVAKTPFWEKDGQGPGMWTDTIAGWVMANRFDDDPNVITSLTAWCRGPTATRIDQFSPEEGKRMVVEAIEKLRPAAKGQLQARAIKSWVRDPFAGGDYVIWGPGQVSAYLRAVGKAQGRVHFAGEHTSLSNRGMEGAMESGERVTQEVAEAL